MRSTPEVAFRLRQEAANLALLLHPPALRSGLAPAGPLAGLPAGHDLAEALAKTPFREQVRSAAERVLAHRFPILGLEIDTGPEIYWRRDYAAGIETAPLYLRRIPYLDPVRAGDHKVVWELNRHQHLVLLAQEYLFSGEQRWIDEIAAQLESWWRENPPQRGINWTSALEVAFRALSWIWLWHFVSDVLPPRVRDRLSTGLYRHGLHLEYNLSIYFSPNTHLLGEAVCLYALGRLFPRFPRAARWQARAGGVVLEQMPRQVHADGSHFEQSAYYHVYALDMFLFYAALSNPDDGFRRRLSVMGEYLEQLLGASGILPMVGDDDGGRFFNPYSRRDRYARETLAACGVYLNRGEWIRDPDDRNALADWWFGPSAGPAVTAVQAAPPASRLFADAGIVILAAELNQIVFDAGPFGPGSAGHSHADTLSIVVRRADEEILIDPGTYTYVGDPGWRNRFRGLAMHNTVRMDGVEQALPATPFSWKSRPEVALTTFETSTERDTVEAVCRYAGVVHRRRLVFLKPDLLFVVDTLEGPPGERTIEQFWHAGRTAVALSPCAVRIGRDATLHVEPPAKVVLSEGGEWGWRAAVFGAKTTAPVITAIWESALPARRVVVLDLSSTGAGGAVSTAIEGAHTRISYSGGRSAAVLI
jgi:Heparinase II/III-like protein/Heparinase II/III N-terminus